MNDEICFDRYLCRRRWLRCSSSTTPATAGNPEVQIAQSSACSTVRSALSPVHAQHAAQR